MLKRLLFLFLFFSCITTAAQRKYSTDKFRSYSIDLPVPRTESGQFSGILVVDKRFDTSKAGFIYDGSKHRILTMKDGVAGSVHRFLKKGYTADNPALPQLLFVLRNLWLHELKAGELKEGSEEGMDKQTISRCHVKIEVYLVKENVCQALLRLDTTAEEPVNLRFAGNRMLAGVLDEGMKEIMALDLEKATAKKTKMPLPELMKLYDQRTIAPRLTNDTLQRGIYLTFADFLHKRPKLYDFVLEQDDAGDFLYLNEKDNQRLFTEFWGFCDGKFHFIKLGNSFFPLVRDGNTYSFFGCLQPIHNSGPRSRNRVARYALFGVLGELHNNRLVNFLRPMQLDMETGKAN